MQKLLHILILIKKTATMILNRSGTYLEKKAIFCMISFV